MIKLLEDNTVICSDGSNVNSSHPEKTSCAKGSLIAKAFTYRHDILYTRTDEHIEELSFDDTMVTVSCNDCTVTGEGRNSVKLIERSNHDTHSIDPLQDYSTESDRVKAFCGIVFDDEVKAAYIASLPTVDEPVTDWRQVTVDLPVMIANPDYDAEVEGSQKQIQKTETVLVDVEETTVLDGAVQKVIKAHQAEQEQGVTVTTGVIDEAGEKVMEEYDTGEVVTKIQYKGELYPSDWQGTL